MAIIVDARADNLVVADAGLAREKDIITDIVGAATENWWIVLRAIDRSD